METIKLVLSGAGGQGMILAATVLAEAAVLHENLNATQTQSYGPEARGGATRADVIISERAIRYPKVTQPNVLVCLTDEAYAKFSSLIRPSGLLLTDKRSVKKLSNVDARQIRLPLYQSVMEQIGKPVVFNICVVGALIGLTGVIKTDSVLAVLQKRFPPKIVELNRKALELGFELGAAQQKH